MSVQASEPAVESARRQRTRTRLLDAALQLFAEHGMHGTSVETIVERAGFTRGAFYSNFDSKESLMVALVEREHRIEMEALNAALIEMLPQLRRERAGAPDGQFPWMFESIMELLDRILDPRRSGAQGCLLHNEFLISALREPEFAVRFSEHEERLVDELAVVVNQALDEIGLRFTAPPQLVLRTLIDIYSSAERLDVLDHVAGHAGDGQRRAVTVTSIVAVLEAFTEATDAPRANA